MRAGNLRHLVIIQQPVEATGAMGDAGNVTWSDFAEVWAAVEPLRGREFFDAQQIIAQVSHKISLRYLAGVTPKMRVLFSGRAFDIQFVRNIEERNRWLELLCTETIG